MTDDTRVLQARITELEAREAEHARAEAVQDALYRIADAASAVNDLPSFYATVHGIVGGLMDAENFYIALYDAERNTINFPYYVDTVDTDIPDPAAWDPMGEGDAAGSTAYVLRTGRPLLLDEAANRALIASGEIQAVGAPSSGDWVGAPLVAEGETLGVIAVQSYDADHLHTEDDRDLLAYVGQHIGSALSRVRAIEETRQRNAELALVNEIGLALGSQLEYDAIIELVGERLRQMFDARTMFVATYDEATRMISFPYGIDEGERIATDDVRPRARPDLDRHPGPARRCAWVAVRTISALGAIVTGSSDGESWLGVPILSGDRVLGVIILEDPRPQRLRRVRRAPPQHARLQHGRRTRERAPLRRDEASPDRDGPAQRRTRGHQRHRERPGQAAGLRGDHRAGRRTRPVDLQDRVVVHRALRRRDEPHPVPLRPR